MQKTWIRLITDKISRFLDHNLPYLIMTPWYRNIGDIGENLYYGLLRARREGKKLIVLYPRELFWKFRLHVTNREMFHLQSDYIQELSPWVRSLAQWTLGITFGFLKVSYLTWRFCLRHWRRLVPGPVPPFTGWYFVPAFGISDLYKSAETERFSWKSFPTEEWRRQYCERIAVRLSPQKFERAQQLRIKMGIPLTDWFACLHVRDAEYRKGSEFYRRSPHQDSSINNYLEGIRAITQAGGWVVRLGDPSSSPLPAMERVIDYPHTAFKSDLMDVYFFLQCRFFVGSNSGPICIAMRLFHKPIVGINFPEWSHTFPLRPGDLAILKHVYSKSRQRFLSLSELLEEPFNCQGALPLPLGDDYALYENTPREIRDVIEEYLAQSSPVTFTPEQLLFNERRRLQARRYLEHCVLGGDCEEEKFRIAVQSDPADGAIGRRYLEQNWLEDSLNRASISAVQAA